MKRKMAFAAALFAAAFVLWTAAVRCVDVQPIGPQGSSVGLAALNAAVHRTLGVHLPLYEITDRLSIIALCFAAGFAALGLAQWMERKRLLLVDRSLLLLGGFYAAVAAAYLLFELCPINFRPIVIKGRLEASYPSSTTLLVLCVMSTGAMQLHARIKGVQLRRCAMVIIAAFSFLMVLARLISGVHWFSDIVGGMLLSAALVSAYASAACS